MTGWVCEPCGEAHGRHPSRAEELVLVDCDMCGKRALCASSFDFGGIALPKYPAWICSDCGQKYGRRAAGICTLHVGECGVCGAAEMVTEPRDYGHLKDGWQQTALAAKARG